MQDEIEQAAFRYQQQVESGERVIVGVNRFDEDDEEPIELHRLDPDAERRQLERTARRARRAQRRGRRSGALARVRDAARGDGEPAAADARGAARALHDRRDLRGAPRRVGHVRPAARARMSEALDYHRATNVAAHGTDEDEARTIETRPSLFKDYGDAERLPLETSIAGPLLQDGAGIVRSQERRDYGGGTIHWRAYSSAGALYPVEAYVANAGGLYSFDALSRALVRIGDDVRARLGMDAREVIVLTGIHERTGWKYMERGYRHVWWDAGTMLANLLALAAADGSSRGSTPRSSTPR